MNKSEVAQLLTIASGFDRFVTVDRVTTEAWFLAIGGVDYVTAQEAVVKHYVGPLGDKTLTVKHVLDATAATQRTSKTLIAADVRAARARGLIDRSWPEGNPLTAGVAADLQRMRDLDRTESLRLGITQ